MSSQNPAGDASKTPSTGATPAAGTTGTAKTTPPAPTPKQTWFRVRCGSDWGKFKADSPTGAQALFQKHFGIRGSVHGFEILACEEPAADELWHSGQKAQNVAEMLKRA